MVIDLIKRYDAARNNLKELEQALKQVDYKQAQDLTDAQIDFGIKRFSFCVDTFWKYLREYKNSLGIKVETNDLTSVLNECLYAALITNAEFEVLRDMLADYTKSSEMYDTIFAQDLYNRIPTYYQTMKTVLDRQPAYGSK